MKRHKTLMVPVIAFLSAGLFLFWQDALVAQAPQKPTKKISAKELSQVIEEITAQAETMEANLAEIDQRLAVVEENVRQARIFARRGGGGAGPR